MYIQDGGVELTVVNESGKEAVVAILGLASISTVLERANARLKTGSQANRTTSFLSPNHGIGVGVAASPEATRYGL
jgi:hypothetical protein